MIRKINSYFVLLLLGIQVSGFSQDLDSFYVKLKNQEFQEARDIAEENSLQDKLAQILVSHNIDDYALTKKDSLDNTYLFNLIQGYTYHYKSDQDNLKAFKCFSSALKTANKESNVIRIKTALIAILDVFASDIFIGSKRFENYLGQYKELERDIYDEVLIYQYDLIFGSKANENLEVEKEYENLATKIDSIFSLIDSNHPLYRHYYLEKAMQFRYKEDYSTSLNFLNRALLINKNNSNHPEFANNINWQIAYTYFLDSKYNKASHILRRAINDTTKLRTTFYNQRLYAYVLSGLGKMDSAYYYLRKTIDIEYKVGFRNNSLESAILSVENETDKLKLDNLESESKRKQNGNLLLGSLGLLLFGAITFFLIQKNTKRKQLLAEQEKELQTQKLATVLKEQELTSIDAMIEGQEKERQRIANDLHDDLGGLMATVKLHFNALKEKQSPELYDKTDKLLDEAYNKVRSVAHTKNSGVMAKKGLLKAINDMATTISASNKLQIDVIDHGLESRLENSLELTIFRIIQELVTNIIKHAEATEASIHITNHDDSLNIMVEDNGKGFDTKNISKKNGMGIHSIDKRIENLGGTVTIESEHKKGTTVIIDIPS